MKLQHSDILTHKDSRINGGKLVSANPSDRITWFTLEELNPEMYVKVREMKVGEISDAFKTTDENNNMCSELSDLTMCSLHTLQI